MVFLFQSVVLKGPLKEPSSELLHYCSRHLCVTFLCLAGEPEQLLNGAQVRAVTQQFQTLDRYVYWSRSWT